MLHATCATSDHTNTEGLGARAWRALASLAAAAACSLIAAPAAAQDGAALTPASRLDLGVSLDSNHGSDGTWLQATPGATYTFSPRWSLETGLPVYYLTAGATATGAGAIGGVGDLYASLSLDFSPESATVYTTFTGSAPTGSAAKELGAGRVSWDWTTHLAGEFGRFGPYLSGGAANNLKTANESLRRGASAARAGALVSAGNLAHAEAGVEVTLWRSLTLTGSGYGVFNLQSTTAAAPVAPVARPPAGAAAGVAGKKRRAGAAAAAAGTIADTVSDHGVGLVLWDQVTPSLDVSVWFSRSLAYVNYTVVSVSMTYSLNRSPAAKRASATAP